MTQLFKRTIHDWASWGEVYQDIDAWRPLIEHIFARENLPLSEIEHLMPGTNAVFKVGNVVVKLLAPRESGMDARSDYETELFGLRRANQLGICAPKLLATGCIRDKYDFLYLVIAHISGVELAQFESRISDCKKEEIGRKLRDITLKMNTSCARFNEINVIHRAMEAKRWTRFSTGFMLERQAWLEQQSPGKMMFTHGDLNSDNIIAGADGELYIIDFADALLAPAVYEVAALLCGTFEFHPAYLRGYFGAGYNAADIAEQCFHAVLMHDFGADMIRIHFGEPEEMTDLGVLRQRIYSVVISGKSFGR